MLLLIGQQVSRLRCDLAQQLWQAQITQRVADLLAYNFQTSFLLQSLFLCEHFLDELHVESLIIRSGIRGLELFRVINLLVVCC